MPRYPKTRHQTAELTTRTQGFLVWLEEFAGELAEDGEVGEVGGAGRVGGLDEPAEHKLDAAPASALERKQRKLQARSTNE